MSPITEWDAKTSSFHCGLSEKWRIDCSNAGINMCFPTANAIFCDCPTHHAIHGLEQKLGLCPTSRTEKTRQMLPLFFLCAHLTGWIIGLDSNAFFGLRLCAKLPWAKTFLIISFIQTVHKLSQLHVTLVLSSDQMVAIGFSDVDLCVIKRTLR